MTPIPLTSTAGAIYAYACSRCHHVSAGSSLWGRPLVTGPHEQLVEASLHGADRCCACLACGVELGADAWLGYCGACTRWLEFTRAWMGIGVAMINPTGAAEEWARRFSEEDDES